MKRDEQIINVAEELRNEKNGIRTSKYVKKILGENTNVLYKYTPYFAKLDIKT